MKAKLFLLFAFISFSNVFAQTPTIVGDLLLCPNGSGTATITNSQVYDSYTWYYKYWFTSDPFVAIPDADGPSFTYDWMTYDQALLKVVVTLDGNTYESNTIQIDSYAWVGLTVGFEDSPNVSINPENGNVMLCQGTSFTIQTYLPYNHVQWYKDGVIISGANEMELHVSEAGSYYVVASPDFCPDSTSSTEGLPIMVEIDTSCGLATEEHASQPFLFYPNPVKDLITVTAEMDSVDIFNMAGQKVFSDRPVAARINLSSLPSGVYIATIMAGNLTRCLRLVKE